MPSNIELFKSVAASDMPREQKTAMQRVFDKLTGGKASDLLDKGEVSIGGGHMRALGRAARGNGESYATGVLIGYLNKKIGPTLGPIALDGSAGGLMSAVSVLLGDHGASIDALNVANACFTAWGIRTGENLVQKRMVAVSGDESEDPILKVAKTVK